MVQAPRGVEIALVLECRDRTLGRLGRDRSGIAAERRGQQVIVPEHRQAFGEVCDRPARGFPRSVARMREEVGWGTLTLRLPGVVPDRFGREPQCRRLEFPGLVQRTLVHVALGRSRHEVRAGRDLRILGRCAEAPLGHRRLDLRAPRRERLDHVAGDARDLETPVRVRFLDPVAEVLQPLRELRPVDRADRHLALEQPVVDHRPPLAVAALDHVGDHAVRVELGVEVARGVVAEGCGHHLLPAHADHRLRRRILHSRLDRVLLDPRERLPHRLVVRLDDAPVAAHHRQERDRLRCGERDVAAGAVLDLPVLAAPADLGPVRDPAFEDLPEGGRIDWPREPERLGPLAGPAAGLPVRGVVLRVVAVALVVARTLRRRSDLADRGYHRVGSATVR